MIPTKQTTLHDPANGKHGDCMSAVIASLLHLPIEQVPLFINPGTWVRDLNAFLRPYGLAYLTIEDARNWLEQAGIEGCYHEVGGATQRSSEVMHACVGVDGIPLFDPHPDNTGLTTVVASGLFIALRPWEVADFNTKEQTA